MTKMEKFKILAEFIKDISSETKDIQTYLFVFKGVYFDFAPRELSFGTQFSS